MNVDRRRDRPIVRRDADGGEDRATSWESLTERLIREAQEAGQFDDLPSHGRRLSPADDAYAGEMAAANLILRNAGVAPTWIEADKQVRASRAAIEAIITRAPATRRLSHDRLRRELEHQADLHAAAVARLEATAPGSFRQPRRVDRAELRDRLEIALARAGPG